MLFVAGSNTMTPATLQAGLPCIWVRASLRDPASFAEESPLTVIEGGCRPLRANRRVGARCYSVRGRLSLCIARLSAGSFGLKCPATSVSCGLSMAAIDKLKLLASRKEADRPSAAVPVAVPATEEDDLPILSDVNTVFLGGLFLL